MVELLFGADPMKHIKISTIINDVGWMSCKRAEEMAVTSSTVDVQVGTDIFFSGLVMQRSFFSMGMYEVK